MLKHYISSCSNPQHFILKMYKLEDFICEHDRQVLLRITGSDDVKQALILLYHEQEHIREDFFRNLHAETKSNLTELIERINSLISKQAAADILSSN